MNERLNLFVGAAEDFRNPARVIRVSCGKPHKGRFYLFSVFARHTYADQKAHGRRHFIRQLTEMIHHAFDVTNIFKHDAKRSFFNSTDRFLGTGKNDFLFGGEVIVDAAVLCSFAALQRSFVVVTVSPFSTKQSRQTPTSSCLFSAFFSSRKTQSPHFCALSSASRNKISDFTKINQAIA